MKLKNIAYILTIVFLLGILSSNELWAQGKYLQLRIDSILYDALQSQQAEEKLKSFEDRYPEVADWLAFGVLDPTSELETIPSIERVYRHPALWAIYQDVESYYSSDSLQSLFVQLGTAIDRLRRLAPELAVPDTLATHVGGLQQSIVVTPGLLSIALDKYLGSKNPVYAEYFTDYQRQSMTKEYILRDAMLGWIQSETPRPREELYTLRRELDYWGEIYQLLAQVLPELSEAELFALTPQQLSWLRQNEKALIDNATKRGEFDSPSPAVIDRYFRELPPDQSLPPEAPRLIGHWLGWRLKSSSIGQ